MTDIPRTPAEIACQIFFDFFFCRIIQFSDHSQHIHDKTRITEPSLVAAFLSHISGKFLCLTLQSFQRRDMLSVNAGSQNGTG